MLLFIYFRQLIIDAEVARYWQDDASPDFSLTLDELVDMGLIGDEVLIRIAVCFMFIPALDSALC